MTLLIYSLDHQTFNPHIEDLCYTLFPLFRTTVGQAYDQSDTSNGPWVFVTQT